MRLNKCYKYLLIGLQLSIISLLVVSLHTIFLGVSNLSNVDVTNLNLRLDESDDNYIFLFKVNPKNNGFLGMNLCFDISLLNLDKEYLITNSTSIFIDAGNQEKFDIVLSIPAKELGVMLKENSGLLEISFKISTLSNLIGISNTLTLKGVNEI